MRFCLLQIGEEFDETTPDGRDVTAKVTLDGNKLVTEQKAKKDGQKSTKVKFRLFYERNLTFLGRLGLIFKDPS